MKRTICMLLVLIFGFSMLCMPVYAQTYSDSATISISKKNVTVGSEVTVTIRHVSKYSMVMIQGSLNYNSSVLQFVSGDGSNTANSGSTVKIAKDSNPTNSISVSIRFKAIAAGSGSLSYSAKSFSDVDDGAASAGTSITVTTPQPSSNANLGSINLSEGKLSPVFKQGTTSYTASVKNQTEKITIKANAAAGDSNVTGAGTFNLKEGENKFALTVTAASGTKKVYTVTVKRMTVEETVAAEKEERENNPTLIVVDGADYFLKTELEDIGEIEGFERSSVERKGSKIEILNDKSGKYQLYFAVDAEGKNGGFFTSDENGEFKRLDCLKSGNRLYIIEPFEQNINVDTRFVPGEYELGGKSVKCYKYADEEVTDFYVFNCYFGGKNDYYRLDAADNTIQREPMFIAKQAEQADVSEEQSQNLIGRFNALSLQAKTVLLLLFVAVILVVILLVLLIIRATKKTDNAQDEDNLEIDELLGTETGSFDEIDVSDISEPETDRITTEENTGEEITADESEFIDADGDNF